MTDETIHAAARALRLWAFQQEYLGRVAADERPFHVQLGKPPAIVFRVTDGGAKTVFLAMRVVRTFEKSQP